MIITGIVLALFIGVGTGLMIYNPLGIGMLTGFSAKDTICTTENAVLLEEQQAYINRQDHVSQIQEKVNALIEKIDATWRHSQQSASQGKSNKEDLLLLQDYYRQKLILEKTLFNEKEHTYDAKNLLSKAQENIKTCVEKNSAEAHVASLSEVASHAVSIQTQNSLQSNLLGTPSNSSPSHSSALPQTSCKVQGSVKACTPVTQDGKTCKAYQECGENLIFSGCKVNLTTCQ